MQLTGSNPVAREDPSLLECCCSAATVIPEMTSEQSEWCRPRSQRHRENRRGVAEQIVLMTWISGNRLFFLQFSFQQGGWGASLADMLVRKCDVLNRGFSGYNTRWAKIILPRLVRKGSGLDSPVAVTIFFGANDSALKDENPKQHVPLEEFVANLRSMVRYLRSVDVPEGRLILITPPPLCEATWAQECLQQGCKLNRLNSVVGEYARACLQVAQDCGADALDLWTLMQKDGQDFSSYLSDGLHLSPKGNEFVFSHLWPLIEKKVSSLPFLLPYWRDIAEARPELSLLGDGDH
ncbi:PREDICTED: isoamyl acetate-hydrolyzing esterase 1 homolog [Bison bison bison]|uniref:Isoamyl acetate-hydrolyzing esterase 1 homolog n=1 Tax=Bison bison bison TaxID=43346 RepID=A0A6P3IHH3_BISBB|nr:PREDICTED: isoamyl acetate-hydrolyzing esterase 1 homolog [Bison bison bison]